MPEEQEVPGGRTQLAVRTQGPILTRECLRQSKRIFK